MSSHPAGFQFSQSVLQDYVACARRFELRYLQRIKWPSVEAEPHLEHEQHLLLGERFHRLVQQYLVGVSADVLERTLSDPTLLDWWGRFKAHGTHWVTDKRYVEFELRTFVNGVPLMAKLDLLTMADDGTLTIVDWKTSHQRASRKTLENRLQTRVYPFVLVEAGQALTGRIVTPEQVRMVYWFTAEPDKPEIFTYDADKLAADRKLLGDLLDDVRQRTHFPLTDDTRACAFCRYRSLCNRGVVAGDFRDEALMLNEADTMAAIDVDFDQIGEIAF